jgi:hypothetical protein
MKMKTLAWILCAAATLTLGTVSYAGTVEVVSSFSSPLPFPRFGLDFDTSTGTLWGIENSKARPNIMSFDLSGNLIQGFIGEGDFNSTGIAVDPHGQRIYYWQNLGRNLQQAHYPDGAFLGTTQFPFGYQNAVLFIDYDPVLNRVVMAKSRVFSPSQGIDIRPGFDFVIPGAGVDFSVELDVLGVSDLSLILGFELTQDSYWLLGPNSANAYDQIVQIDRTTGQLVDRFILPDSHSQTYRGLALDPSTGLFYANFSDEGVRALRLTPGPAAVISVKIDIKPGSFPNSINPRSKGVMPVAILTTPTFDATTVDPARVLFGATGTQAAPARFAFEDVDGDGDTDMMIHFRTQDTGILCGDTSASLTGKTFGGQMIKGSDSIKTAGCK